VAVVDFHGQLAEQKQQLLVAVVFQRRDCRKLVLRLHIIERMQPVQAHCCEL
jgi:hypothetical protein